MSSFIPIKAENYLYLSNDYRLYNTFSAVSDQKAAYQAYDEICEVFPMEKEKKAHSSSSHKFSLGDYNGNFLLDWIILDALLQPRSFPRYHSGRNRFSPKVRSAGDNQKCLIVLAIISLAGAAFVSLGFAISKTLDVVKLSNKYLSISKKAFSKDKIHPEVAAFYKKATPLIYQKLIHKTAHTAFIYLLSVGFASLTGAAIIAYIMHRPTSLHISPVPLSIAGGAIVVTSLLGMGINLSVKKLIKKSESRNQQIQELFAQIEKLFEKHLLSSPHLMLKELEETNPSPLYCLMKGQENSKILSYDGRKFSFPVSGNGKFVEIPIQGT